MVSSIQNAVQNPNLTQLQSVQTATPVAPKPVISTPTQRASSNASSSQNRAITNPADQSTLLAGTDKKNVRRGSLVDILA